MPRELQIDVLREASKGDLYKEIMPYDEDRWQSICIHQISSEHAEFLLTNDYIEVADWSTESRWVRYKLTPRGLKKLLEATDEAD